MMNSPEDTHPSVPLGWFLGWLVTVCVGIAVAACVGCTTVVASEAIRQRNSYAFLLSPSAAITMIFFALLFSPILVPIPVTIVYVVMRLVARRIRMTFLRRLLFGLAFGFATSLLFFHLPRDRATGQLSLISFAPWSFPLLPILASAVALALIARPCWFGVPRIAPSPDAGE